MGIKSKVVGIMENKVSRRIALGSMVAGLGGAALVIRALKGRYNVNVPEDKYVTEWEKYVKMLAVPIKEIEGPATFTLNLKPQVGTQFRAIYLFSSYVREASPGNYPQPPVWYTVTDRGQLAVIPPIVDDRPAFQITAPKETTNGPRRQEEKPGGKCIVVPRDNGLNDGLEYYEVGRGAPKKLRLGEVNSACAQLATGLLFEYPSGKPLAKGVKWIIPQIPGRHATELPCEVAGFANVAGIDTVKILAEKHLNNREYQQYITRSYQEKKEIERDRGRGVDVDARMKRRLKQTIEEESTEAFHIVSYVDLKTGLTVRKEWRAMFHIPKAPHQDQTQVVITQLLSS